MSELFTRIIEMSLMGSVVILITILTRFILRKRSKSFIMILWAVVAIRLLVPFSIESAISVFNLIPSNTQSITEQKETVEAVIPDVNYASGKTYAADNVVQTNVVQTANENNAVQAAPEMKTQAEDQHVSVSDNKELAYAERIEETSVSQKRAVRFTMPDIRTVLGIVWLTGATGILTYCSVRYINLKKRLKDSKKIHDNVYISKKVRSPFVFGFFIPKIYLPEAFENSEKEYILMHERTHIKYGDWITKIIGMVIVAVHWFNPLVWIAYALFEQDIEMRCDEVTISNLDSDLRQAYTLSLISYAKKSNSKTYLVTPLGFSKVNFSKMEVTNRVKNIVYFKQGKKITAIFITAALLFVAAACGLNSKTGKEDPEQSEIPETSETTAEPESSQEETESSATEKEYGPGYSATDSDCEWITHRTDDYEYVNPFTEETETYSFIIPQVNFNTFDAEKANEEINEFALAIKNEFDNGGSPDYYQSHFKYSVYNKYLTLVFGIYGTNDIREYYTCTFNTENGERVSNSEIFNVAKDTGYPSITEAGTAATKNFLNRRYVNMGEVPMFIDGKPNPEHLYFKEPTPDYTEEILGFTFNDENLNENMRIGLDPEGNIFFISQIFSEGGAPYYEEIIRMDAPSPWSDEYWW